MSRTKAVAAVAVLALLAGWAFWAMETETPPEATPTASGERPLETDDVPSSARKLRARPDDPGRVPDPEVVGPARDERAATDIWSSGAPDSASDLRKVTRQVVDERGVAVARAGIRILRAYDARVLDVAWPSDVRTNQEGRFTTGVPRAATDLVVRVSWDGHIDADVPLVEGEDVLHVRLQPAWTLRGAVVSKETAEAVPGAAISVLRAGTDQLVGMALADGSGAFAIEKLPIELLDVRAAGAAEVIGSRPMAADPGSARRFAPTRVSGIPPRSGDLRIELAVGRTIEGTLVDGQGAPVRTPVSLAVIGRTPQGGPDYSVRRRIEILDEGGAFCVEGLADGLYDFAFEPRASPAGNDAAADAAGATRVAGVAAGTRDLRVVLAAGAPLRLRVLGPDAAPLQGGYVYVYATGGLAGDHGTVVALSGLDGRVATVPLDRSKRFDFLVTGVAGFLQARGERIQPGGDEIVVTLERGGSVKGRVLDEDGRAVGAGVPVIAAAQGGVAPRPGTGWAGSTDATGAFVVDALGDHAFSLAAGGAESGFVPAARIEDVRIGRDDLVLRVRRGVALSGRLRDADGKPVRTHLLVAHPIVIDGAVSPSTRIDGDDGRFVFRGVTPGRVRLSCYVGDRFVDVGECDAPATDVELALPGR